MKYSEYELWLIGFDFYQNNLSKNLYTFFLSDETNFPISTDDKKVILFEKNIFLKVAEKHHFYEPQKTFEENIDLFCDIKKTINIINCANKDTNTDIVDNINILTDIIDFLQIELPIKWKQKLYALLDFLTFDENIGEYFEHNEHKADIISSVYWLQETILNNSIIVNDYKNMPSLNFIEW